jgi:electron transfer flavoprotein beta subunit
LNIAVCVKQIPGPDAPEVLDAVSHTLVRSGTLVLDDSDRYSVEVALRLTEQASDGEVVLVSMAPAGQSTGLRSALAMGAARAVLVSDPALAGCDALGTAKVLAAAVAQTGADLVLCATESTDGYTGTVPVQLAELLGYPSVSFARHLEFDGQLLRVDRQTELGYDEVLCPLPAVVTVTAGVVEPRYPSVRGIIGAKSKPVNELSLVDLGIDPSSVGAAGARQVVVSVEPAELRASGEVVVDNGSAEERIIAQLSEWKVI